MNTRHNTVAPAAVMTGIDHVLSMLRGSLLGRVCDDLQYNYQTVADLTLFILIGMANFACQDGTFVRSKNGTLVPLNGYFWVSGLSNCGKSTLIVRLLEAFHKAEEEAAAESVQARRRYEADRRVRASVERNLMRDVDKAIASGKDPSSVGFMLGLQLPAEIRPPLTASWLLADATIQALRHHLLRAWPSAGLVLEEGVAFLSSGLSRAFRDFCTLYDARLEKNARMSSGIDSVVNAFLSQMIAMQPGPLYDYLRAHGQKAFDTGFLSRLRIFDLQTPFPPRVPDGRVFRNDALNELDERILTMKREDRKRMKNGAFEPLIIEMSSGAEAMLPGIQATVQTRMAAGMYARDMVPYALRLPMSVVRTAGVLHRIEGYEGPIAESTMQVAIAIELWLAHETNKVFVRLQGPTLQEQANIDAVMQMINLAAYENRRNFVMPRELYLKAPSYGLDEASCKRSLHFLYGAKVLTQEERGNATMIRLSPQFFPTY
jgi:hypothetical protein